MTEHRTKPHRGKKLPGALNPSPERFSMRNVIQSGHFRFAMAFIISCVGIYSIIFFVPGDWMKPINEHTARTLGYTLNVLGMSNTIVNDTVSGGGLAFKIISECTALLPVGLFLCFVVFYPHPLQEKIVGLAVGTPFLYLGNLFRLVAVFMVSRYDRRLFETAHVYLGQVFTIFLVILACVVWLKWLDRREPKTSISWKITGFLARFTLISGCLFFIWMEIHHWYIWVIDWFVTSGFSLFGWRLIIPRNVTVYYETFNIVTFASLVLATGSVVWTRRIKGLAVGLGILFVFHLLHRLDNVLMSAFGFIAIVPVDYVLCAIGQYVLPFLLWLVMTHGFPHWIPQPTSNNLGLKRS